MKQKISKTFVVLLCMLVGSFAQASVESGEIRIGMESRHYDPGEGFPLNFNGPIKVTGIRVLTQGDRGATLNCSANGVSCGSREYKRNWVEEWMSFRIKNPRQSATINLNFGRKDPEINDMIIEYQTTVNTVVKEVIKWKKIYVPKSQLGEMVEEVRGRWYDVYGALQRRSELNGIFKLGWMQLSSANRKALTHDASDPDRRVGEAVDKFLKNFACTGFADVYGTLAHEYMFSTEELSRDIDDLGIAVFKLADIRRYDPDECSPEIEAWLDENPEYSVGNINL